MPDKLLPVQEKDRIASLDIMRGFAILGIFLVNMMSFHSPLLYLDPHRWWDSSLDKGVYAFIDIFAQASFYPLFSLLFGYGVIILRERAIDRGYSFAAIGSRRFLVLLAAGILHAFLIWHGDILVNYAVFGLIALLFFRLSGKALLITGILLYILPNLLMGLLMLVTVLFVPDSETSLYDLESAVSSSEVYKDGTFAEITSQRITDWYMVNNEVSFIILLLSIMPLFLIGAGAAKLKLLEKLANFQKRAAIMFAVFFAAGLLIKLVPYIGPDNLATEYFQDLFGGPLLAASYAIMIALMADTEKGSRLLMPLTWVGRMSLSNYLFQSIVCTLIFYGYGLGFYGDISMAGGTLLAVGIYLFQILLSRLWLTRFKYGPFEWLWRSATYLSVPPIRRIK
ncbi:DUF418 domain-containing protein [Bacillus infantis]|uniref:DUF418 domain-containing protein n=1 Tax=Bacillus infantis TaxID=324767 RepID=UPI002FBD6AB0